MVLIKSFVKTKLRIVFKLSIILCLYYSIFIEMDNCLLPLSNQIVSIKLPKTFRQIYVIV